MTKSELISEIAGELGTTKAHVEAVHDALIGRLSAALVQGETAVLHGLGRFSTHVRAARKGRNPATGEDLDIPAKTTVKFSAAKALKDALV